MLVDTDFLLALLKPSDGLKEPAQRLAHEHAGTLRSTEANLLELLLVLKSHALDPIEAVLEVDQDASFPDRDGAVLAARNIAMHGLTPFDAVLAAHAEVRGEPLISSDKALDRIGVQRIPLRLASQGIGPRHRAGAGG
ncbi:MAG: PIN domain-containing protein [Halobacteriales archaeon]|nr:PIN domain-containing protein [Halobacteriales archaeon]